jgi:hypothetical protein
MIRVQRVDVFFFFQIVREKPFRVFFGGYEATGLKSWTTLARRCAKYRGAIKTRAGVAVQGPFRVDACLADRVLKNMVFVEPVVQFTSY